MEKRTVNSQPTHPVMYCNNCGGKGHLFRMCKDPVLSCGLLLLDTPSLPMSPSSVNLLMIRRKDSISFAEFMRGKYDPEDPEYVSRLVRNMTLKEQAALASETFESLWRMLWGDDRASADYLPSYEKFNQLDRMKLMRDNLSVYTEPEWGFPKGRRMRGETDVACAIREFDEETNIPRDSYLVLKNMILEESFVGLNGVKYKHIYFVAVLKHPELLDLSQRFTTMQRREISAIAWKSMEQAEALIRPHHVERSGMLDQLKTIIETFEIE